MAKKDVTMTPAEVGKFLETPRSIQVATIGPNGFPHAAPMWYLLHKGKVAFRSFSKSQKIVNLRRDSRLTLLAEEGDAYNDLRGVMIKGNARFVEDRDLILEWYGALTARYAFFGPKPKALDSNDLEKTFGRFAAKNTGVIVDPIDVISWDYRKLGGTY